VQTPYFKTLLVAVLLVPCSKFFGQQNEAFKAIKSQVDYEQQLLQYKYQMEYRRASSDVKGLLENQWNSLLVDFQQHVNSAYVEALIKVKNQEDLQRISNLVAAPEVIFSSEQSPRGLVLPQYATGIDGLRQDVSKLFYFDSVKPLSKPYMAQISFIVDKQGVISQVEATGEDPSMNRQAQIAFYLLPRRFIPAFLENEPVAYRYDLPLILSF